MKKEKLRWHAAFFQAVQNELSDYIDLLEFQYEYQLTAEPLRIDLLIIKKPGGLTVEKNIGRIFRAVNIVEYKSPDDYLSVKDFLKVYAYANLYAAITPAANLSDITLTFIENRYPRKLFSYLTETRKYQIKEISNGIYSVIGDYLPIQIIQTKKLSEKENLWLKSLKYGLEINSADVILEEAAHRSVKVPLDAYIDILLRANPRLFKELQDMAVKTKKRRETFEEVFTEAGIIPEWMERGFKKGIEQGIENGIGQEKISIARNLLARGSSLEFVQEITGLDLEVIKSLQESKVKSEPQ